MTHLNIIQLNYWRVSSWL